jgi:hypothetical protein
MDGLGKYPQISKHICYGEVGDENANIDFYSTSFVEDCVPWT